MTFTAPEKLTAILLQTSQLDLEVGRKEGTRKEMAKKEIEGRKKRKGGKVVPAL